MTNIRAFIAVSFPLDALQAIRRFVTAHEAELTRAVQARFVSAANIHLTLRFLGDTNAELRYAIRDAMKRAVRDTRPLTVRIVGFGAFPNVQRARVLWVGLDEPGALPRIQRDIETELLDLGLDPEDKPFRPHVTVARVKSARHVGELTRLVESYRDIEIGSCVISEVALYESRLHEDGPIYHALERCAFGDG